MQVKAPSCKKKKTRGDKYHRLVWAEAHLKLTEAKFKSVPWSDGSKGEMNFWKPRMLHTSAQRGVDILHI